MANHLLQPDALALDQAVLVAPLVALRDGQIAAICRDRSEVQALGEPFADLPARAVPGTLLPGFVDLQVNGAGGRGVDEASPDALETVAQTAHATGTAAFLPTLITAPFETLLEQIRAVAAWIEARDSAAAPNSATPLGIHVEGPFLSNAGAHPKEAMVDASPERIAQLMDAGRGHIRLVTLSPNRPHAAAATKALCEAGITVALGHGYDASGVTECVQAGARMATHLFNAMGPSNHRDPGLAGQILAAPQIQCSLIADEIHVHPLKIREAFATLGSRRTILVTDAVTAMGMPDGSYALGTSPVTLADGVVRNADGALAGSALDMIHAAQNFLAAIPAAGPWTLAQVAATNPARAIREIEFGSVRNGGRAEFMVLTGANQVRPLALGDA